MFIYITLLLLITPWGFTFDASEMTEQQVRCTHTSHTQFATPPPPFLILCILYSCNTYYTLGFTFDASEMTEQQVIHHSSLFLDHTPFFLYFYMCILHSPLLILNILCDYTH